MSELVDPSEIEQLVGVERHGWAHYGRAVSGEQVVYILHSSQCKGRNLDLRACDFSLALDRGIDEWEWHDSMDRPVRLVIFKGRLVPAIGGEIS